MRVCFVMAAAAAFSVSAASAQDDVMASRYGNTTVVKTGSGHEVHTYYNADHTFTGNVVDVGFRLKGTWAVDGGTLCLTYDPPPPGMTNPVCQPVVDHKVGDSWTTGDNSATLVAGLQ